VTQQATLAMEKPCWGSGEDSASEKRKKQKVKHTACQASPSHSPRLLDAPKSLHPVGFDKVEAFSHHGCGAFLSVALIA
jgi:hypothetical protein